MSNLFPILSPDNQTIHIPADVDKNSDPYLALRSRDEIKKYYHDHGYVVIRNLIPESVCDLALRAYYNELKPYPGYLYRQASANPEKNLFTEHGFMLNSLLNIQDLPGARFPEFKKTGLNLLTNNHFTDAVRNILGEPGILVQSMFFEGNQATWAHQDTYYLDSEKIGNMVAAWIAVEDINPGAGRFYVYPGSHKIDIRKNGGDFDIAFNHDRYKNLVLDIIKKFDLKLTAPSLKKGDVLFWNSKTIHGSLVTTQPHYSRSSFTAHFIPASERFLQYQTRIKSLDLNTINDVKIHSPKNQDLIHNRLILLTETLFPKTFQTAKKIAIKLMLR